MNSISVNRTLIIHNPLAGKGRHNDLLKPFVRNEIPVIETKSSGHATQIVKENFSEFDIFIAAGGDGTVNEIAKALTGTEKFLAIIPMGSGNGLVNEIGSIEADELVSGNYEMKNLDTLFLNEIPFFNLAGIGFEALVAEKFANRKSRGLLTYVLVTLSNFFTYKSLPINYLCDGTEYFKQVFSLTIANSKQYGNNAIISPASVPDDGVFEVCTIEKFSFLAGPAIGLRLFFGSIFRSNKYSYVKCTQFELPNESEFLWNLDGEPLRLKGPYKIWLMPSSLKVISKKA